MDAIEIVFSFSGHVLSVEGQTNHGCNIAKITGDRVLELGTLYYCFNSKGGNFFVKNFKLLSFDIIT